jgi:hypothetical protein
MKDILTKFPSVKRVTMSLERLEDNQIQILPEISRKRIYITPIKRYRVLPFGWTAGFKKSGNPLYGLQVLMCRDAVIGRGKKTVRPGFNSPGGRLV